MVIKDQIIARLYNFKKHTMKEPSAIYLGHRTRLDLLNECQAWELNRGQSSCREEFNGVPIFTVNDEYHLNIG